jgi:LysM repeat protein
LLLSRRKSTAKEATPMRVPVGRGAPAGLLLAFACLGCSYVGAYVDSIRWRPPPERAARPGTASSSRAPASYVVRTGDTLGEIGAFYGVSVAALASANRIADPNRIEVGRRLVIPRSLPGSVAAAPPRQAPARKHTAKSAPPANATRADLETRLHAADELVRAARFEEALSETDKARPMAGAGTRAQRVRLELLAATASIALGRDAAAEQSFERALRADADLELDPASVSPKVVRRFDETRRRLASESAAETVAERAAAP